MLEIGEFSFHLCYVMGGGPHFKSSSEPEKPYGQANILTGECRSLDFEMRKWKVTRTTNDQRSKQSETIRILA